MKPLLKRLAALNLALIILLALLPVSDLEESIEGCAYEEKALMAALSDIDLVPYLGIITLQELVDTICNK